jgi:hypothetical protein
LRTASSSFASPSMLCSSSAILVVARPSIYKQLNVTKSTFSLAAHMYTIGHLYSRSSVIMHTQLVLVLTQRSQPCPSIATKAVPSKLNRRLVIQSGSKSSCCQGLDGSLLGFATERRNRIFSVGVINGGEGWLA